MNQEEPPPRDQHEPRRTRPDSLAEAPHLQPGSCRKITSVSGAGVGAVGAVGCCCGGGGSRRCWRRSSPVCCRSWTGGGVGWCWGADARALGHGGIRLVARAAGVAEVTVSRGVAELVGGSGPSDRVRREGGGRKRLREEHPGLVPALLALVEPDQRGDPESPLLWTTKSTRKLAGELTAQGLRVGPDTVAALLKEEGFSLQGTSRTTEGARRPDRDVERRRLEDRLNALAFALHARSAEPWAPGTPVAAPSYSNVPTASGRPLPCGWRNGDGRSRNPSTPGRRAFHC